ncbi:MAG TPA: DCC1-like thiol-disulfide oxidoreductase family protein [bacterium]
MTGPGSSLRRLWRRAFLEERPSVGLAAFRPAVALTVGAHVLPSLFELQDNYLRGAFKAKNHWFFPQEILTLIEASPDWLVIGMASCFVLALASFALGLRTQRSAIAMTGGCYYFYALNAMHIGTLSFDILLVTLVLVCATEYPGDALSLDAVRRGDAAAHRHRRPFFVQRLLQLQLTWTFWYTALSKISAGGNWLTGQPFLSLMQYPPEGVVRAFPLRAWLGGQPQLCHWLGVALVAFEFVLPALWWIPRTRRIGIMLGVAFQLMLWGILHVPTIFLFMFPALMGLFVPPERIVSWIEDRRADAQAGARAVLVYDGACGFCRRQVRRLQAADLFGWVRAVDAATLDAPERLAPGLDAARCRRELVLIEPGGRVSGGFAALARLTRRLPLLWWAAPALALPGASWVGGRLYRAVAARRRRCGDAAGSCGTDQGACSSNA